jgi:hypothetical protein
MLLVGAPLPAVAQGNTEQAPVLFHAQSSELKFFKASEASVTFVRAILAKIGLPMRFEIYASNVPNAAASIIRGKRVILYNPEWMAKLVASAGTNWAMVQILAHEVGHHLSFHEGGYTNDDSANHSRELEADYFSGYILARLGSSVEQATVVDRLIDEPDSSSHPGSQRRIAEVARGWNEASGKLSVAVADKPALPISNELETIKASLGSSYWDHNGSTMLLIGNGAARRIYYSRPREGIRLAGATAGTLLFAGERDGSFYQGISHIFRGNCGKFYYEVTGQVEPDDQTIILKGKAPRVNAQCQIYGSLDDTLVFTYLRSK